MSFPVFINPPPLEPVTVDYATADGSAQAGVDYTRAIGTLTFPSKTISRST